MGCWHYVRKWILFGMKPLRSFTTIGSMVFPCSGCLDFHFLVSKPNYRVLNQEQRVSACIWVVSKSFQLFLSWRITKQCLCILVIFLTNTNWFSFIISGIIAMEINIFIIWSSWVIYLLRKVSPNLYSSVFVLKLSNEKYGREY